MDVKDENIHSNNLEENLEKQSYFLTKIVWKNVLGFAILHVCLLYGLYLLLSFQVPLATSMWSFLVGYLSSEGVTMGAHRMWSHRAYKGSPALKAILLITQTMAGQNCIWIWCRDHRLHHKYSDTDADPHNSKRGFFFCHMGWLMMKKHPEVIKKGMNLNMSDLNSDPWVMFQKKYYKTLYFIFAFFIPIFVPVLFWGDSWKNSIFVAYFARYLITLHGTWCVNSVAHFYGTRPYTRDIPPVESNFVSFISSGEGWHNYHHTFPWDYKAAEFGKHYNATASYIEWLASKGYAYDLRTATSRLVGHRIARKGDGTHPISSLINNEQDIDLYQ